MRMMLACLLNAYILQPAALCAGACLTGPQTRLATVACRELSGGCLPAQARASCRPTGSRRRRRARSGRRRPPAPRPRPQATAPRLRGAPAPGTPGRAPASRALPLWGSRASAWRRHWLHCLGQPRGRGRRPARGRLPPRLPYLGLGPSAVRQPSRAWLQRLLPPPMHRRWHRRRNCSAALRRWLHRRPRLRRRARGTWKTLGPRVRGGQRRWLHRRLRLRCRCN